MKGQITYGPKGYQVIWGEGANAKQSRFFELIEMAKEFALTHGIDLSA